MEASLAQKDSHCSWCGHPFAQAAPWPRRCSACGYTSYKNPLPVVVALLPLGDGLVVVRRNIEPAKGTLTLPGGFLDSGETWQQGLCRELKEETGIAVAAETISIYEVANGLDDTIVIFGLAPPQPPERLQPFSNAETQEVALIRGPVELGFPNHSAIVKRYFAERDSGSRP